jgi:hypothetical protein
LQDVLKVNTMRDYRTPTPEEARKLAMAREMMQRGISEERDPLTRFLPTGRASAAREMRGANRMRNEVPMAAREGEAYNQAGYADGGSVGGGMTRGDGCVRKGHTKGTVR